MRGEVDDAHLFLVSLSEGRISEVGGNLNPFLKNLTC